MLYNNNITNSYIFNVLWASIMFEKKIVFKSVALCVRQTAILEI